MAQGVGLGFLFVPLSAVTFSTLPDDLRTEAAGLFSLMRNIGSSIGISVVITYLAQRTQANHAALAGYLNPFSLPLRYAAEQGVYDFATPQGLIALNAEATRQAALLAYLQDFRLMMWVALAAVPLIALLRAPSKKIPAAEVAAAVD